MSNSNLSAISGTQFLTFENTDLNIIDLNGSVWLTAGDLSRALGYKDIKSISNLYNRNKDEFRDDETALIDLKASEINGVTSLMTSGNLESKTRIYSTRGCWTIAFLARTDRARAFRTWVKDVLENLNPQPAAPAAAPKQELPSFLQNVHGQTLFRDAVTSSAYNLLVCGDFTEEQRYMQEQVDKRVASRMEDIACHAYEGLRLLVESDSIGGFDTKQIMPGVHLLENKDLAAHILSAKGPLARYIPTIMQACAQRMQEVCNLPLAGVEIEGLDL